MSESSMAQVLGRIPSGLFVLTTKRGKHETGMLASWVMQAGFEPPMVSVAVQQSRFVADWLSHGSPFVLNILSEKEKSLLRHFGRGFEPDQPAFDGLDIERCSRGVAVLLGTVGHLECVPVGRVDSGDHRVFVAEVVGGRLAASESPVVHIRKSGLRY
jgi:flavin reductase (DIM6/NTAB) family NADH-FMN oxidoreductase RutF